MTEIAFATRQMLASARWQAAAQTLALGSPGDGGCLAAHGVRQSLCART